MTNSQSSIFGKYKQRRTEKDLLLAPLDLRQPWYSVECSWRFHPLIHPFSELPGMCWALLNQWLSPDFKQTGGQSLQNGQMRGDVWSNARGETSHIVLIAVILMEHSGKLKISVGGGGWALLLSASCNISKVSVSFPIKGNFYFSARPVVSFLQWHNVLPLKDNPVCDFCFQDYTYFS